MQAWTAGDEITAEKLKRTSAHINAFVSGEAINASASPIAIYIDSADQGELKIADSGADATAIFHGFVGEAQNVGNSAAVYAQIGGIMGGFSGLTAGLDYYLSTAGAISTTPGTRQLPIGIAISATEIFIIPLRKIACGQGTRTAAEGSGDEVLTHNLGVLPKLIKIWYVHEETNSNVNLCWGNGTATGTGDESCTWATDDGSSSGGWNTGQTSGEIVHTENSGASTQWQAVVASVTPLIATLTFTGAAGSETLRYQWEIYG